MPIVYINDNGCHSCQPTPCNCQPHVDGCDSCADPDPCTPDTGCPILLDTTCSIYRKHGGAPSGLTNLEIPNGANLTFILDTLDDYLGTLSAYSFPPFVTTCMGIADTTILTITDFMQAVDDEFCSVQHDLDTVNGTILTGISNLTSIVNINNNPGITSACVGLAISATDNIKQILIKLKDAYCSLYSSVINDQSPVFLPNDSNSLSWFLTGTKNHTPTASVRKSIQPGNVLQILPDGLFVGNLPALSQTLSYDSTTRTLSLSGSGGSVQLPIDVDAQTLALNTSTNILTISGGNSVDFTPLIPPFVQVPNNVTDSNSVNFTANGTANTNITADVKISGDAGNQISIHSDGIFGIQTPIVANDSSTINFSTSGTFNEIIDANVKISADAGNQITAVSDGLFVPAPIVKTAKVVIPSASVLTLFSSPVTLVAAQGTGTTLIPISQFVTMSFNSAAYTGSDLLTVINGGTLMTTTGYTAAGTRRMFSFPVPLVSTSAVENKSIQLTVASANPTLGDSDLTVYITYMVVTL